MIKRRITTAVVAAGAASLFAATPALAAAPAGYYNIYDRFGQRFVAGATNIMPAGITDDRVVTLKTTLAGNYKLPFPIYFYGYPFRQIGVSSNGNVQFGIQPKSATYTPTCLPTSSFSAQTLMVMWEDLIMDSSIGEGVFVKTTGRAPNRKFYIVWKAREYSNPIFTRAEVVFTEGSSGFLTTYADNGGGRATIGVQGDRTHYTQRKCTNDGQSVVAGQQFAFQYVP